MGDEKRWVLDGYAGCGISEEGQKRGGDWDNAGVGATHQSPGGT